MSVYTVTAVTELVTAAHKRRIERCTCQ